jgi:hypothetical protein
MFVDSSIRLSPRRARRAILRADSRAGPAKTLSATLQ